MTTWEDANRKLEEEEVDDDGGKPIQDEVLKRRVEAPLDFLSAEHLQQVCGRLRGIQGHYNSCYLDTTLFAMFTFTHIFDAIFYRPPEQNDDEVRRVLLQGVVNPLRRNFFVSAGNVMKLRELLDSQGGSNSGFLDQEKDPEEFLTCLLGETLHAEPFLKLSTGLDTYCHQIFVEEDASVKFPTVQHLLEQSFLQSNLKLKQVPPCLILQMPRFGKSFKMFPCIRPSLTLDITDLLEGSPRQCAVCGKLAQWECKDCYGTLECASGLESISFCKKCLNIVHAHEKRSNHAAAGLALNSDEVIEDSSGPVPRVHLDLFAVICIETSHYVAFVKAGSAPDAPWCFFDSMSDRIGGQNGYNIPQVVPVPDLKDWLLEEGRHELIEPVPSPEYAKRLLCDAYICMYQSSEVIKYNSG